MAISAKIIGGNGFNEGGGVAFTNNTGAVAGGSGVLNNTSIEQSTIALPGDGGDFHTDGITASFNVTTLSSGTLVSAHSNRSIEVIGYTLVADAAATVTWLSGTSEISGAMAIAANGGITQYGDNGSLYFTNPGEALVLVNSGTGIVGGSLTYRIA